MIERSKSANTESIPNIALPLGLVVSMPWVLRNRSTLRARSSSRKLTRSFRLRPSRSTNGNTNLREGVARLSALFWFVRRRLIEHSGKVLRYRSLDEHAHQLTKANFADLCLERQHCDGVV